MSILENIHSSTALSPPRIVVYGPHGIGKSTLGASMPDVVAMDTEDGLRNLDVPTFGLMKSFDQVVNVITALAIEKHPYKSFMLDTLDGLELLVQAETCKRKGWSDFNQPFGRGPAASVEVWKYFLDGMDTLRDRGMTILLIGHSDAKRFEDPVSEPYDRYQLRLQPKASALVCDHVDAVLFAGYRTRVKSTVEQRTRAAGERLLWTYERPAAAAKNRYNLPETLPLEWAELAEHIPYYKQEEHGQDHEIRRIRG